MYNEVEADINNQFNSAISEAKAVTNMNNSGDDIFTDFSNLESLLNESKLRSWMLNKCNNQKERDMINNK